MPARRNLNLVARSAQLVKRLDTVDLELVRIPAGQSVVDAVNAFKAMPDVELVQPNYVRRIVAPPPPDDPFWLSNTLYGLVQIRAQETWTAFSHGSPSVIVAVIDTGVQSTHPDLAANMWQNPGEIAGNGVDDDGNGYIDDVYGIDTFNHDSNPADDHGHGTHTAGTIAGIGNNGLGVVGVTWNARILACKFLGASGSGSDFAASECFNYITALKQRGQNIRVSSNSWGGYRGVPPGVPLPPSAAALKAAIDTAGANGILSSFAAGNDNNNNDATPFDPAAFSSPSIIAVAASDSSDNRAGFSNYGVTTVDLAAPGVGIVSTYPFGSGYASSSGTSMASPHVAGAAALLLAISPGLTVDQLKNVILANVDSLTQWQGVVATGGRLNVFRAAQALGGGSGGGSATFVGVDTSHQGNWMGAFGTDGYSIVADATSLPSYASLTPAGQSSFTWASSTADIRGLQRAAGGGRLAATWYAGTSFDVDINLSDAGSHRVAFYMVDWDPAGRQQRVDVLDSATSAVLDSRAVSSFQGGQYLIWNLQGHVKLRFTRLTGPNAVVSGVFFGPASNAPPTVALTAPSPSAVFPPGATIHLAATATDSDGSITSVVFRANGSPVFTDTSAPYEFDWPSVPVGSYSLTAVATDNGTASTTSAAVSISVSGGGGGGNSAAFAGTNTTSQGNWTANFGADGYNVIGDAVSYPAYATVTPSGNGAYTWEASTSDVRGLLKPGGGRIAGTWYSSTSFDIDVNVTGGSHLMSLYSVDWDTSARAQRFDVLDATTLAVLDTRTMSGFHGGVYLSWNVTGHVKVRVTRTGGVNAVVSGIFFGTAGGGGGPSAVFIGADSATSGNWPGVYGTDGVNIIGDTVNYPFYGSATTDGASWVWAASTADTRALRKVGGSDRIAATWYGSVWNINLTLNDAIAHRVSLYCVDYDFQARQQRIEVLDATTSAVLDTRLISGFSNGVYLTWAITGSVRFRVTSLAGPNAVVSGLFFDPSAAPATEALAGQATAGAGDLHWADSHHGAMGSLALRRAGANAGAADVLPVAVLLRRDEGEAGRRPDLPGHVRHSVAARRGAEPRRAPHQAGT